VFLFELRVLPVAMVWCLLRRLARIPIRLVELE